MGLWIDNSNRTAAETVEEILHRWDEAVVSPQPQLHVSPPISRTYLVKAAAPAFQVRPRSLPGGKRSSSSRITIP
jgi:hypothetical protein